MQVDSWTCRENAHILRDLHNFLTTREFSQSRILEKWNLFTMSPKPKASSIGSERSQWSWNGVPGLACVKQFFFSYSPYPLQSPANQQRKTKIYIYKNVVQHWTRKKKYYHKLSLWEFLKSFICLLLLLMLFSTLSHDEYYKDIETLLREKIVNLFIDCYPYRLWLWLYRRY